MNNEEAKAYFKDIDRTLKINPDQELLNAFMRIGRVAPSDIIQWYFNGPNSIKMLVRYGTWVEQTIIFTYKDDNCWSIQTLDHYINEIKKEGVSYEHD